MKNWCREDYELRNAAIAVGPDGEPRRCRNGHEVGDVFTCECGCPGGFCSKSMPMLFPLMEAVRSGGDLSYLLEGASQHEGMFHCPDGVVNFRLEATRKE